MCIHIYIYIYIYIHVLGRPARRSSSARSTTSRPRPQSAGEAGGNCLLLRFDSFRFRTFRGFIGSVRFGSENCNSRFDVVRPAFFGRVVARSGSVRFVSASGSGRFQNWTARFDSVRPVRFDFFFLPARAPEEVDGRVARRGSVSIRSLSRAREIPGSFRGTHLSNTTCL